MTSRLRNAARVVASEYVGMPRQRVPGHTPTPPPPLIGPSGSPRVDAVSDVVNRAVEPFRTAPNPKEGVCGAITHYVGGALGILGVPFEMMDTGFAMLTAPIAALFPGLPAATLMAPHLGPPHTHTHPPSLVPPAPPVPLPSIGMVMLPGCVSVFHSGVPAARAGDIGAAFTCGTLSPALDVYTGSSNTFIGGSRAARMTDITRHCNPAAASAFGKVMGGVGVAMGALGAGAKATAGDALGASMAAAQAAADAAAMALAALLGKDPSLPPGYGVVMMGTPMVLIGGFPMPDLMDVLGALFKAITKGVKRLRAAQRNSKRWRNFSNRMHQRLNPLLHRLGMTRNNRRRMHRALCFLTGHPVDVATGNVLTDAVDLELPGPLPLKISRDYYSCDLQTGPFGNNWSFAYDLALLAEPKGDGVVVRMADGRPLLFPPCAKGQTRFDRRERATLVHDEEGYSVRFADGLRYLFGPATPGEIQPLVQLRDRAGHKIRFFHDERGDLERIVDSSKRTLELERDDQGRIVEIAGPTPEGDGRMAFARYFYDRHGDLVEVHDALGQAQRYVYNKHLLVQETDRNGLSFYFEYDGDGAHARCLRTWGDGGIYDHKLEYDAEAMTTKVTDSLGRELVYHLAGNGLVAQIDDDLGGSRRYDYNEWGQLVVESDELGRMNYREYDERGNESKWVEPTGASAEVVYNNEGCPLRAVDANGSWWQWSYDEHGRLIERQAPDGSRLGLGYAGAWLTTISNDGELTQLGYDRHGNIHALRLANGALLHRDHDFLGRELRVRDERGGVVERRYDALGRVVEQREPDGNVRRYRYDGEGALLVHQDADSEVELRYQGMGWLSERRDGSEIYRFEYDTEGQLLGVVNAGGRRHGFELDRRGQVVVEVDFAGRRSKFERDAAGQIVAVVRNSGLQTTASYDAAGRVIEICYPDDSKVEFGYRPGGELVAIDDGRVPLRFERDPVGRVLREYQGEAWVERDHDRRGRMVGLQSSRGFSLVIDRNPGGEVRGLVGPRGSAWRAEFSRDERGLELERELPGGVRSRWTHDAAGRPVHHQVWQESTLARDLRYDWAPDLSLSARSESVGGQTVQFGYSRHGQLAWSQDQSGRAELRMPDAVGNLFRTQDRSDRSYGPGGTLLEASSEAGVVEYEYDDDGQLVEKRLPDGGSWRYTWSARGTLDAIERPNGERVTFAYDALGRRVEKCVGGQRRRWLWYGDLPLHEWDEVDGADGAEAKGERVWVFEPESFRPALVVDGSGTCAIVTDQIGAPVAMFDEAGTCVWRAELTIYGELEGLEGEREACPFRWPGQYEDVETGLYYNRHRYYDPETGLYLSPDPIGLRGGLSPFAYVSDPLVLFDPLGLAVCAGDASLKPGRFYVGVIGDDGRVHITSGPMSQRQAASRLRSMARTGDHTQGIYTPRRSHARAVAAQAGSARPSHHGSHVSGGFKHFHPAETGNLDHGGHAWYGQPQP